MGFFDKIKKGVTDAANQFQPQQQQQAHVPQQQHAPEPQHEAVEEDHTDDETQFDVAGFDVMRDEGAFFNAVLHMESEGMLVAPTSRVRRSARASASAITATGLS